MNLRGTQLYMNPAWYTKFTGLLPAVQFQKSGINFTGTAATPLGTIAIITYDCAQISIAELPENCHKKKK